MIKKQRLIGLRDSGCNRRRGCKRTKRFLSRRRRRNLLLVTVLLLGLLGDDVRQDHNDNEGEMTMGRGGRSRGLFGLPFVMAADIFMMGNSYTSANSLSTMVRDLFRGDTEGGNCGNNTTATTVTDQQRPSKTVDVQAPGGWKIYQHTNQITSNSNSTHSQMLNAATQFVILQDQSQVPSCTCFGDEYTMNIEGIRAIRSSMPPDVDLILFMTWGRMEYDNNVQFNNCFSEMQNSLRIGYESYRDYGRQQLVEGRDNIYVAPVGYAFKYIHDNELCSDNNTAITVRSTNATTEVVRSGFSLSAPAPTCVNPGINDGLSTGCSPVNTSSLFASLYSGDGSHPQLGGSYLAACVLFTTMTGISPIGRWGPTGSISTDQTLQLQQIAHKIVLEDYYNLGYDYPWQRNNNSKVCTDPLLADTIPPVVVATTNHPSPQTTQEDTGGTIDDRPTSPEYDTPNESSSLAAWKRAKSNLCFLQWAIVHLVFTILLQQIIIRIG